MQNLYDDEVFMDQVRAAMGHVTDELGHEVWSRNLDDNTVSYAFCVPATVYNNKRLCRALRRWLKAVFAFYGLGVMYSEWLPTSVVNEFCSRYVADWCGSRCRNINIGQHLYFELEPAVGSSSHPGPAPPGLPLWHTYSVYDDCYNETIRVAEASDRADLGRIIAKRQFAEVVLSEATSDAWTRLRHRALLIAANYSNHGAWSANCTWKHVQ